MRCCALLLAAGQSQRFGAPKQLADYRGKPLISYSVSALQGCEPLTLFVALGANADAIQTVLPPSVTVLFNPEWPEGMGRVIASSVRQIVTQVPDCTHLLIALADQPEITTSDYVGLLALAERYPERRVAAEFNGRLGAPALFGAADFDALTTLSGDQGARALLMANPDTLAYPLPAAAWDIDTQQDLQEFQQKIATQE